MRWSIFMYTSLMQRGFCIFGKFSRFNFTNISLKYTFHFHSVPTYSDPTRCLSLEGVCIQMFALRLRSDQQTRWSDTRLGRHLNRWTCHGEQFHPFRQQLLVFGCCKGVANVCWLPIPFCRVAISIEIGLFNQVAGVACFPLSFCENELEMKLNVIIASVLLHLWPHD